MESAGCSSLNPYPTTVSMTFATNTPPNMQRPTTRERAEQLIAIDRYNAFSPGGTMRDPKRARNYREPPREDPASIATVKLTEGERCLAAGKRARAGGDRAGADRMFSLAEEYREEAEVQIHLMRL